MTGKRHPQSVARVTIEYDSAHARIVDMRVIAAPAPILRPVPGAGTEGAWVLVRDPSGKAQGAVPLAAPFMSPETFDEDGMALGRLDGDQSRVVMVDLPFPGPGSRIEVHVAGRALARDPLAASRVAEIAFDPRPLARDAYPDPLLVVHEGWGEGNGRAKTVLFLAEGFIAAEMGLFLGAIDRIVGRLAATPPFSSRREALRIAHAATPSRVSGIGDLPRDTAFRGRFTVPRVIEIDQARAAEALNRFVPASSAVAIVIANTAVHGGSGGAATVCSLEPVWMEEIAIHELGHGWFGLADEYAVSGQPGTNEPVEANVSGTSERAQLKWADLVRPDTALPTLQDSPPGVVGAFEGAKYHTSGVFRPSFDCKMRTLGQPFCPVCLREIDMRLTRHMPAGLRAAGSSFET